MLWTPPPRTLEVQAGMLDAWAMLLLSEDAAHCAQIETPAGYLIKVLQPEQDFGGQPDELQEFIKEARTNEQEWILVRTAETATAYSMCH